MPYSKLDELPEAVKGIPTHAQEIWMAAFNSSYDEYSKNPTLEKGGQGGFEEKAFATAWSAVEKKYKKEGNKWVAFEEALDETDWFEIFRTGEHIDSEGRKRKWNLSDIEFIASSYNPDWHKAPFTIGHPKDDSPAYGWTKGLKVEGDRILAKGQKVLKEFVDWFRSGAIEKVSMGLYPDMTLKHIGFLGANPPAVKGLRPPVFKEDKRPEWIFEEDFKIEFQQGDREKAKQAQEARSKQYNIAIKDGGNITKPGEWSNVPDENFLDPVNYRYPCPDADQTRAAAGYWGKPDNQAQYSSEEKAIINKRLETREKHFKIGAFTPQKGGMYMDLGKFFSDLKTLIVGAEKELAPPAEGSKFTEVDLAAAEKRGKDLAFAEAQKQVEVEAKGKKEAQDKLKEIETQKYKGDIAAFCEAQCKEGKLTPALRKIIEPIMNFVSDPTLVKGGEGGFVIEFAEGVKKSALEGIKDFLTELPKVVTFKEVAGGDGPTGGTASEKLMVLTKKRMEEKKDLSFSVAFAEVQKENIELAKEVLEEIRPSQK
jgi:cation transport regulator ChaB